MQWRRELAYTSASPVALLGEKHTLHTLLSLTHTRTRPIDLTRLSPAAATCLWETMQTTNHRKAPFSLTVGNSTTLHLPINPHLSLCHDLLSAVLGLLHDSRFEGLLLRLDLVKKKDVRTREEALLCLRRVCHGRSISPIRIWSLRVKHDLDDGWVSFFNISRLIWHQPWLNDLHKYSLENRCNHVTMLTL